MAHLYNVQMCRLELLYRLDYAPPPDRQVETQHELKVLMSPPNPTVFLLSTSSTVDAHRSHCNYASHVQGGSKAHTLKGQFWWEQALSSRSRTFSYPLTDRKVPG